MRSLILLAILLSGFTIHAQKGCYNKPMPMMPDMLLLEDDSISPIKTYRGQLESSGYKIGEKVLDLGLFTYDGYTVNMISHERPRLYVTGSYTCPIFRNKVASIDSIYKAYKDRVDIYVVYVVEAHPNTDKCPYRDSIWITEQNKRDGVLYPQARTYEERRALAAEMRRQLNIQTPIIVDNSNNDYWMHYGPAPNNAYLVDKDGIVIAMDTWYTGGIVSSINSFLKVGEVQ